MAYTPKTWTCGETITDAGLNNIEQGIQEALGCCESELPEVTAADNGKVLTVIDGEWDKGEGGSGGLPAVTTDDNGDILTVVDGEWEKAEPGYSCSEEVITVFDGNLTTTYSAEMGGNYVNFSTSEKITADPITVTFDSTEYELPESSDGLYGEWDASGPVFTTYPCAVNRTTANNCLLWTSAAGTYSVKIEQPGEVITTTECFEKAVRKFGLKNIADGSGSFSIVENDLNNNVSSGQYTHTEGINTKATSDYSHAEGNGTTASGVISHAEGLMTTASGDESHAEGQSTTASGSRSHAEGQSTTASGSSSHAEGSRTTASGDDSHAEGYYSTASGIHSHAEGRDTIANHRSQHAFGEYNVADPSTAAANAKGTYIEIVGNGTANTNRSNARTLDWSGNEVIAGTLSQSSDRRLKEHIDYLGEDAEEFIRGLKPAHYIKDDRHHVGFYAQDVEELDKWDCMTGEMNGYKTLGYTEIIAPLVAYCQSLEKRIQELENK